MNAPIEPDSTTRQLLDQHREALVIYLDRDEENEGEFKLGIFNKVRDGGVLMPMLASILDNLINVSAKEHSNQISSKAAAG
jgi:hypothetical protein